MENNVIKITILSRPTNHQLLFYYANQQKRNLVVSIDNKYYTLPYKECEITSKHTYYDTYVISL